jgi:hypothetical protein
MYEKNAHDRSRLLPSVCANQNAARQKKFHIHSLRIVGMLILNDAVQREPSTDPYGGFGWTGRNKTIRQGEIWSSHRERGEPRTNHTSATNSG